LGCLKEKHRNTSGLPQTQPARLYRDGRYSDLSGNPADILPGMAAKKAKRRKPKHRTDGPPLSVRDIRFCQKIVCEDTSVYEAYLAAGFPPKVNRHATDMAAFRLVRNREIREYIRELQHYAMEAAKTTIDELAADFRAIKEADLTQLVGKNGEYLHPHKWPKKLAKTIESIELGEVGVVRKRLIVKKVKVTSKMAALSKLAEWKRMTGQDKANDGKAGADPLVIEIDTSESKK
jgi:phage terminase small subunit